MSEYIGTVGAKVSAEVTLVNEYAYTDYSFSYYGTTNYIYTMKDEDGNVLVWKTTSTMIVPLDDEGRRRYAIHKGDVLRIEGKVKAHDEYKGTKQTVLTRCKFSLVKAAPTEEEIAEQQRQAQLDSLSGQDFIWKAMPYKQYKEHYSDCETLKGSFTYEDGAAVIDVIIREGRLKNSGVRGMHYSGYQFRTDEGKLVSYRAVSPETARKQLVKEYPNGEDWELVQVFKYSRRWY
jgi:hypothetical protein